MELTYTHAVVLGIVEGLTEFLPVSSTGHMILTSALLGLPAEGFLSSFQIIIQLGAILAVVVLYARRVLTSIPLMTRIAVAFLPTAAIGFLAYPLVKHLLGSPWVVVAMLAIGGVVLIVFERYHRGTPESTADPLPELARLPYRTAFLLGLAQTVALIPGVSRSGATILGGLFMGMSRPAIVEFSFLLAMPTMLAATGFEVLKNYRSLTLDDAGLLAVGFVTAFVVALAAVRWFLAYVSRHTFTAFGIYRIVAAVLVALILLS